MTLRTILAGVALASLLTGCGGSDDKNVSPAGRASRTADIHTLWQRYVQCLRKHGAPDYPDPIQDTDGRWRPPPHTAQPPQAAIDACRSSGIDLKNETLRQDRPPLTAAEVAKLRRFAQCMRQHGLPRWPDPKSDGTFVMPDELRQAVKNPSLPAMDACRQYMVGALRTVRG